MNKRTTTSHLSGDIPARSEDAKKMQPLEKSNNINESDVTPEEKALLEHSADSTGSSDEQNLEAAILDNTDDDGELLNEKSDLSGDDLDIPGVEDDDDLEEIGEEDEENNSYSLGADKND